MRFSGRTDWELGESELAAAVRAARSLRGEALLDLTVANPTGCGFAYDAGALLGPLGDGGALVYEPESLGMVRAREGVCGYYAGREDVARRVNSGSFASPRMTISSLRMAISEGGTCSATGGAVGVERVCLTTSTSEGYSFLFRVLCDAGDEVLVASPSYPLFEFIARLDGVVLREYPLVYDAGWVIDRGALEAAVTERTRAVIVVHPNNPTGNYVGDAERIWLDAFCAARGLALIVDEVFLDYAVDGVGRRSFVEAECAALTFCLSGISKVCGLPQMKASWVVACGPAALVAEAMGRLEIVADTFLSMNAPVQFALPAWLQGRGVFQGQVLARVRENLRVMDEVLAGSCLQRLVVEGGWTCVVRVPQGVGFVRRALEAGVVVQPGEFYGLGEGWVVVSLLTLPEVWRRGLEVLVGV